MAPSIGAPSKKVRVNPMMYAGSDGRFFVFASKAGADPHPDWYHNLSAHPRVTAEIGAATKDLEAVPLGGSEWDRLYATRAEVFPGFAEYAEQTSRTIPMIELIPA